MRELATACAWDLGHVTTKSGGRISAASGPGHHARDASLDPDTFLPPFHRIHGFNRFEPRGDASRDLWRPSCATPAPACTEASEGVPGGRTSLGDAPPVGAQEPTIGVPGRDAGGDRCLPTRELATCQGGASVPAFLSRADPGSRHHLAHARGSPQGFSGMWENWGKVREINRRQKDGEVISFEDFRILQQDRTDTGKLIRAVSQKIPSICKNKASPFTRTEPSCPRKPV
jgi:hypothetical protein